MEINDYSYWITLAHLPNWRVEKVNHLIFDAIPSQGISFAEFFSCDISALQEDFCLSLKEAQDILQAKETLPRNSILAEELLTPGFELIPLDSAKYPTTLRDRLRKEYSPPLLYVKGNTQLFFEDIVGIVGSRNVSDRGIEFTKRIVKKWTLEHKVIVSGYAKGVDRIALETAIENNGRGIVVLPQGIMTFKSGFKNLYEHVIDGQVLVVSTYPPKAGWSAGFAMGRNTYIYGMAREIYVAESDNKGGTWSGVIDGLRKGRKIFVRKATPEEKCANNELIAKGAIAVDEFGDVIDNKATQGRLFEVQ
jgi:predicted Rossmann fold nucleotide-binding protein DprA/Smf involved in DNA uptake